MGHQYYPIYAGHSIIYQVDSTVYDDFYDPVKVINYQYKLKTVIADSFTDNTDKVVYRLLRYKKTTDSTDWIIKDVWQMSRTKLMALRTEENRKYIKMIFPIVPYKTWNGNAYNDRGKKEYQYLDFTDTTINNKNFNSTMTVEKTKKKNLIEDHYAAETYAEGIGLISSNIRELRTGFDGKIESGYTYKQVMLSYK